MIEYSIIAHEILVEKKSIIYTSKHLSFLADVMLNIAYIYGYKKLCRDIGIPLKTNGKKIGYSIISLGKLGGEELNFNSDIDIIFVYDTDDGYIAKKTNRRSLPISQFFLKLSEKVYHYIGSNTDEGFVFRIDTRLRPNGQKGPLAMSIDSYGLYYEVYGQTWERLMLLKARPSAGNLKTGIKFIETIKPFILRKSLDYTIIDELATIKSKIDHRSKLKGTQIVDVKLGIGGIREVEFITQALQILNYPKYKNIYNANTIKTLNKLKIYKILNPEDYDVLIKGYLFLRRCEDMIQLEEGLQKHSLPINDKDKLIKFSKYLGFDSNETFMNEYNNHTKNINKIFENIFTNRGEGNFYIDEEFTINDYAEILKKYGINQTEECAKILMSIIYGTNKRPRNSREKKLIEELMAFILEQLKNNIDPKSALNYFEQLFRNPYQIYIIYDIFKSKPEIINEIIYIFSTNDFISKLIINTYSIDYIYAPKDPHYKKNEILNLLIEILKNVSDEEYEFEILRKKHKELLFNVAYSYITKKIDIYTFMKSLTELAEGFLLYALDKAYNIYKINIGEPYLDNNKICGYLIIGMGKLGSYEMSVGSDLDIVFIYEGFGFTKGTKRISNQEFFAKVIQKAISYLSTVTIGGYLYKIDMRLRPSGSSGMLVTTIESFEKYYINNAMVWEKQSLLKGRPLNVNISLNKKFFDIKNKVLFKKSLTVNEITDIYNMRFRIEKERTRDLNVYDIKSGYGGIIDIEFIVQFFQLYYGYKYSSLKTTKIYRAIDNIFKLGLINNRNYNLLKKNYTFYKKIENLCKCYNNINSTILPKDKKILQKISLLMDYKTEGDAKLIADYKNIRSSTRGCFKRVFNNFIKTSNKI